jgi:hypothetical protein
MAAQAQLTEAVGACPRGQPVGVVLNESVSAAARGAVGADQSIDAANRYRSTCRSGCSLIAGASGCVSRW